MLHFFRSFLKSKVGAIIGLLVLGVIALAFASGDIAGFNTGSSLGAGTSVAKVGSEDVTAEALEQGTKRALERVQQQNPNLTMKVLLEQGAVEQVLGDLIDRAALFAFGKSNGVEASDRLVDSELAQIPAFQGVDGKFDQNVFRQALAQQRISEQALRGDIRESLVARQLMAPAQVGSAISQYAATRYAALLDESRSGTVIALPSLLFTPEKQPEDAELAAFYKANSNQFIRPERRTIRYAVVGEDAIKAPAAPTESEIAARFQANKAAYGAADNRKITQLIVPTEAAAKAVVAEVQGGKSLEVAAREKGLTAAPLEFFGREQLSTQFSPAVAQAVFAAPVGKLAAPQKSVLGWHVIRVDQEQKTPARTLAEVRGELSKQIASEKRRSAFTDAFSRIEQQFADGANLNEVAKSVGAQVQTLPPVTADGNIYLQPGKTVPDQLRPVLETAFKMDQEQPQVAEVERGKTFAIFDVTDIAPSAPAPLAQIKDDVKLAWAIDAGSKAAKAAAIRMQAEIRKGRTVEQVIAASGKKLPAPQQVSMSRATLAAAINARREVPPPVSLLFHMSKGSVKVQSAAGERGWFVVLLKDIVPGKVESSDLVKNTRNELGDQVGQAYADAFGKAVRKEVGVRRNAAAIKAVRDQLAGSAAAN